MNIRGVQQPSHKTLPILHVLYLVEEKVALFVTIVRPKTVIGIQDELAVLKTESSKTVVLEIYIEQTCLVKTTFQKHLHLLAAKSGLSNATHSRNDGRLARQNGQDGITTSDGGQRAFLKFQQYSFQFLKHMLVSFWCR